MDTPLVNKDSSPTQASNYEFRPDFNAALERAKSTTSSSVDKVTKTDLHLEDCFGSWREWD